MTTLTKPVHRKTREPFFNHGADRGRLFVATLAPGDLLTLRPLRTRAGGSAEVSIKLVDVYRYALLCRVNCAKLEKASAVKAKKAAARERRRLDREIWGDKQ
jgi:hypothetical protein